jgi:integrase
MTVGDFTKVWLSAQEHLRPSTKARYEGIVDRHVLPTWRRVRLSDVTHADVVSWVAGLSRANGVNKKGLAPATVRYVHRVFALVMGLAVRDGRLPQNPADRVRLPRATKPAKRYLAHAEVAKLAAASDDYATAVQVLAYCGLRWGELAALRAGKVDLLRRRMEISESVTEVRGHLTWGAPKSGKSRSVPIPRSLVDDLTVQLAGLAPTDLVFTGKRGGVLRNLNFRRDVFDAAATAAGLPGLTPHELRHTAASLAVASGANVKAVQRMLGHASAAMTLDVYADLFEDDLDGVADRLDEAISRAAEDQLRTEQGAEVISLGAASL